MIRSKVLEILRYLSNEEMKKFHDYLNSPFFNNRKTISKLFNVYKEFHPEFNDESLTKECVFEKLFPGKPYNDEIIRNLNSDLLKFAEDFLAQINFLKQPFISKKHILAEINDRNIPGIFEKNFEEAKNILEKIGNKDINYVYNYYTLFTEKDINNSLKQKFSQSEISEAEKYLIAFFIMKILEIQNYVLYECRIFKLESILNLEENFIDRLFQNLPQPIKEIPLIQIYYNAFKLESTHNKKYYSKLKQLIQIHGSLMERANLYNKYIDMVSYIRNYFPKNKNGTMELFKLRKEIIEKNLKGDNFISNTFFINLVNSALTLKKFEWVRDFIVKYNSEIFYKYRESTTELCYALLFFEQKNFDESLSHLAKVKYEDTYYNLEVKSLTAKIHFELNNYELLNNHINSYRMYLSKNRSLDKKDFSSHNLFISYIEKLIRILEKEKFYKLNELVSQINKVDFVNKNWVLEKISSAKITKQ